MSNLGEQWRIFRVVFTCSLHLYISCNVTWRMGLASGQIGRVLLKHFRCVSIRITSSCIFIEILRGDKFKMLGTWPCSSSINTNNIDNSTYSVFTIFFQEPALPLLSGTGTELAPKHSFFFFFLAWPLIDVFTKQSNSKGLFIETEKN